MKNKQIEEIFFGQDINTKRRYITYLSYLHIINSLAKRDSISNDIINDHGVNYVYKFKKLYKETDYPLCFLNDKTLNLFQYTKPHITKIINRPSQAIIKEKKLIQKSKLKVIDSNTFRWLATKPGTTFKEKLSNQDKVLSTVKRYSYNTKENQVFVSYINTIRNYFSDKKELMTAFPILFGDVDNYQNEYDEINKFLGKISLFLKADFFEVQKKEHAVPNNKLIGNIDYASIWNANQGLKKDDFGSFKLDTYYRYLIKCFALAIMSSSEYEFIDKNIKIDDEYGNYLLYRIHPTSIQEISFDYDGDYLISFDQYNLVDGQYELDEGESKTFSLSFEEINEDKKLNRGMSIKVTIDEDDEFIFNGDLNGLKIFIENLASHLKIRVDLNKNHQIKQFTFDKVSLNSYDNQLSDDLITINPHIHFEGNDSFIIHNKFYFVNRNNVYLDTYSDKNKYHELLKNYSKYYKKDLNSILIYDVKDTFDEFSSKNLRNTFSNNFPNSYPVWRSILSAESVNNFMPDLVVDLTGKEVYATTLGRKMNLFVHRGPIMWPIHLDKYSEKKFLEDYLELFAEDENISFSDETINDCLVSGSLSSLLKKKKGSIILVEGDEYSHEYIKINYNQEIFDQCQKEFFNRIEDIQEEFKDIKTLVVVPDFINATMFKNVICNKELKLGSKIIGERVLNHETAWYECLPDLSLEVIKNGYYDSIKLVENKEYENVIGKTSSWVVNETFVLSKDKPHFTLPLIKSFIGEQNKMINASIKDPSFPLKDDIEVNLKLSYRYGSENTYILTFVPVNKDGSPFKKIVVDWEDNSSICLNELPNIRDISFTNEECAKTAIFIEKNLDFIDKKVLTNHAQLDDYKTQDMIIDNLRRIMNDYQRLYHFNYSGIDELRKRILKSEALKLANVYLNNFITQYKRIQKPIYQFKMYDLEQFIVQITQDRTLFTEGKLMFPESSFGRYLAANPEDDEVINLAYNKMLTLYKTSTLLKNDRLRYYFDRFTSATAVDHLILKKLSKINASFVYKTLEILVEFMRELSEYDFSFETKTRRVNPKEIGFTMRYCVELLIACLYIRDERLFEELRPEGRFSQEIIYYLKKFNKNYQNALARWPKEEPRANMRTKYRMVYKDKPEELYRMWDLAYCLILYISGAREANNIIIDDGGYDLDDPVNN